MALDSDHYPTKYYLNIISEKIEFIKRVQQWKYNVENIKYNEKHTKATVELHPQNWQQLYIGLPQIAENTPSQTRSWKHAWCQNCNGWMC